MSNPILPNQVSVVFTPCLYPHCHRRGTYRRGLCVQCYQNKRRRRAFALPPKDRHAHLVGMTAPRAMPEPTEALPGTPEKLAVLVARAAAGQQLWHPLDGRLGDATPLPAGVLAGRFLQAIEGGW